MNYPQKPLLAPVKNTKYNKSLQILNKKIKNLGRQGPYLKINKNITKILYISDNKQEKKCIKTKIKNQSIPLCNQQLSAISI